MLDFQLSPFCIRFSLAKLQKISDIHKKICTFDADLEFLIHISYHSSSDYHVSYITLYILCIYPVILNYSYEKCLVNQQHPSCAAYRQLCRQFQLVTICYRFITFHF